MQNGFPMKMNSINSTHVPKIKNIYIFSSLQKFAKSLSYARAGLTRLYFKVCIWE